jgi:hypothetical protein
MEHRVDHTSWDIVTASNIGAVVSALVALPQLLKATRERESVHGISSLSLLLQVVAIVLFGYVNVRLGLWLAALQNGGVLISLLYLFGLKHLATVRSRPAVVTALAPAPVVEQASAA